METQLFTPHYVHLPDGYNGAFLPFLAEPVKIDGDLRLLQCMRVGKEYLRRWVHVDDLNKALNAFKP